MFKFEGINLFVGDIIDNQETDQKEWAIIHATQTTHYPIFGWNRTDNKPDKNHPNYILYEKENHLSINWVDGAAFLYKLGGFGVFIKALDFVDKWIADKNVLIHCDQGYSRSPSLCLLYLAKRKKMIPDESYDAAKVEFLKMYPNYNPGGIGDYIRDNWEFLL
jgi:Dual specificity phosphatase, catalytic domain